MYYNCPRNRNKVQSSMAHKIYENIDTERNHSRHDKITLISGDKLLVAKHDAYIESQ